MKTALVTGASSGIGKELAREHAKHGGNVVLVARSKSPLQQLKEELEANYGIKAFVIVKDLTGENAAKEVFDEVSELNLQIDILINNAGVGEITRFLDEELTYYQQMIQLNIGALTDFCYHFSRQFSSENGEGKILNVASTAAFQAIPNMAVYAATKAYVLSLSESLAVELKKRNISVTVLCPGPTKTEFVNTANVSSLAESLPIFASAKDVAEFGYRKMNQKQMVAIPGFFNKMGANSSRVFPRKGITRIFGEIMNLGNSK